MFAGSGAPQLIRHVSSPVKPFVPGMCASTFRCPAFLLLYSSPQKFCPIVGWVPAADTERWDRLPACLFMNDGQDARRHQILFFFAFIFENPCKTYSHSDLRILKRIKYSVPEFVHGQNRGEFFRLLDLRRKSLRMGGRHEGQWLYEYRVR